MSGTEHWFSAADFREANGASVVISSDRKTSSGNLRNHTQLLNLVIKSQTDLSRELKMWPVERKGKKKNGRDLLWRNEESKKKAEQWMMRRQN